VKRLGAQELAKLTYVQDRRYAGSTFILQEEVLRKPGSECEVKGAVPPVTTRPESAGGSVFCSLGSVGEEEDVWGETEAEPAFAPKWQPR